MIFPLSQINPGERVQIVCIASDHPMKQRLFDLGFSPNESVSCVLKASRNGMSAYLVRNAVIALRKSHASEIFVELV